MSSVSTDKLNRVIVYLDDCPCEDCQLRGTETLPHGSYETLPDIPPSLTADGSPAYHPIYGFRLTSGCDGCGGTGISMRGSIKFVFEQSILERRLTMKQCFVMRLRLGLKDGKRYKQWEIARLMGVTRQAIADHEAAARKRLMDFAGGVKTKKQANACVSTPVEAHIRKGGASVSNGRRPHQPHVYRLPRQVVKGSSCWDLYFAGTKDQHTS